MEKHVTVLGAIHIALGVIGVLLAAFLFFVVAGAGWISQDRDAIAITTGIATLLAGFLLLLSVPQIVAGAGILAHKQWARILTLILGVLHLFNIPIGTIAGLYTFWVLMDDRTAALFGQPLPQPVAVVPPGHGGVAGN